MSRQRKHDGVNGSDAKERVNGEALGASTQPKGAKDVIKETGPSVAAASIMLGLIFGGCCSNVWHLSPPTWRTY
jgi:hypothetical protein